MKENQVTLEVCADSVDSALIAQTAGAGRIEFCNNLKEGGTTPSFAQIEAARRLLDIKLYVLIRPRGGDFLYNDLEFEIMKSEIHFCGKTGCDGVVIGILLPDGEIDTKRCAELVRIAKTYSMGVTFHRAFDRCKDFIKGMEDILALGCERILTSGGKDSAWEGKEIIKELVEKSEQRIGIMAGAGITPENIEKLIKYTKVPEIHGTFRSRYSGEMIYRNVSLGNQEDEYTILLADVNKIRKVKQIIER